MNWAQRWLVAAGVRTEDEVRSLVPLPHESLYTFVNRSGLAVDKAWPVWNHEVLGDGRYGYLTRAQFRQAAKECPTDY